MFSKTYPRIAVLSLALSATFTACNNDANTKSDVADSSTTTADTAKNPAVPTAAPVNTVAMSPLEGAWELTYITGPRIAFDGLYPNRKPQLVFQGNAVSGNTSCNNLKGNVTVDTSSIKFGPLATTKMACPGQGEQVFLSTLSKIQKFQVSGDTVLHFIMGDIGMMKFKKVTQ